MLYDASTVLLAVTYPLLYTGPVTVIRYAVGDDKVVAQQVVRAIYVASLMFFSDFGPFPTKWTPLNHIAWLPSSAVDVLRYGVIPVVCLFVGSLYSNMTSASSSKSILHGRTGGQVLRDIVFAPILEEFVFRAHLIRWLLVSRGVQSVPTLIFTSPAIFSLAHVHHFFMNVRRGIRASVAARWCFVQSIYTYVFGIFAMIVLLKSRSVWVSIAAHATANSFGFPNFGPGLSRKVVVAHGLGLMIFLALSVSFYRALLIEYH